MRKYFKSKKKKKRIIRYNNLTAKIVDEFNMTQLNYASHEIPTTETVEESLLTHSHY